ncbi:insulinase family protein [Vitreoscilla massiliensis]|uniref:Insulinase family protein n=1 Tax=Vitreoscilla massiliensis TaxID=1689272 RepID=A0ABY4E874_9NEIS|nr:pitrilysin family protein [Vitreoscilla massiliensis]UOO91095.1 insulinase family protein [Vitreoscilla massiliensis]
MRYTPTLLALAVCSMVAVAHADTIPATPLQAASPVKSHNINIQRWQMDNGAKVLLVERHELPLVDIDVAFDAGTRRDAANKIGVADYAGALMDMGAGDLSEEDIRKQSSDLAVTVASYAGLERSGVRIRSLSEAKTLQPTLALANTILTKPRYEAAVLKREQDRSVLSLKQNETNPQFLGNRAMTRLNYPKHPYGYSAWENEKTIRAIKVADLQRFHAQYFRPQTAVISIVGDMNRSQAEQVATTLLAGLPQDKIALAPIAAVPVKGGQTTAIAHPASQAHLALGLPVFTRDDPDYFPLLIGNYTLGAGGFDSLLMQELRDKRGYTYGAGSSLEPLQQKGEFSINMSTKKASATDALKVTKEVVSAYVANGPTEAQLQQAKANIIGGFPMRFDTNAKLLSWLGTIGFYNLPSDYLDTYTQKVNALTTAQIREAWQRRIKVNDLNVVVVGGEK